MKKHGTLTSHYRYILEILKPKGVKQIHILMNKRLSNICLTLVGVLSCM